MEVTFGKMNDLISKIRGQSFTSKEIAELSFEIRNVLLEADIPYDYIKSLVSDMQVKLNDIKEKKLNKSAVIGGILQSYIDATFANSVGEGVKINANGLTTISVFGPNGVGKTTFVAKLANLLQQKYRKKVSCISFDITRYAAQEQLKIMCDKCNVEFIPIIAEGIDKGILKLREIVDYEMTDILIVDQTGIAPDNEDGFSIWQRVLNAINFDERIIVLDGTFGQNSLELIKKFDYLVNATGFVVSKIDSDQKGGVFFSIRVASDKPIYYISTGEKMNNIAEFNKRIISDAFFTDGGLQSVIHSFRSSNQKYIQSIINRDKSHGVDYNDLLQQLQQLMSFGRFDKVLSVLPHTKSFFNIKLSTEAYIMVKKWMSIIYAMTPYERKTIKCLNIDRMNRIAKGAGVAIGDVITLRKKLDEINSQA